LRPTEITPQTLPTKPNNDGQNSGRGRIFFELLDVAVFDLLHEGFALENVALEIGGKLAGHDEKLIADDFRERNGATRRNQMRTPLEDEASVPESRDSEKSHRGGESGALGAEELSGAIEENGESKNEKRSERNEKAVAVRRDASPIRVAGDEKIKSKKAGKQGRANERFAAPQEEEPDDGEKKNGCPREKAVIGREKHR
jgi:hypothetical protein